MWSNVIIDRNQNPESPPGRYKHGMCLVPISSDEGFGGEEQELWIYGGRSGTFPMKDLWKLRLTQGIWTEISQRSLEAERNQIELEGLDTHVFRVPGEDIEWPPCLQEHTMVHHRGCLYVFGGEISINYEDHTPLWIYNIQQKRWRKWSYHGDEYSRYDSQKKPPLRTVMKERNRKNGNRIDDMGSGRGPMGRRGHTACVYGEDYMLIYGGYRDLKGSLHDLWAFHFKTESWHLFSNGRSGRTSGSSWWPFRSSGDSASVPPPRHNHSCALIGSGMYVYGGMSNLEEMSDLWRYDLEIRKWHCIQPLGATPGCLKGHVAVAVGRSMLIFGGEKSGKASDEVWRFDAKTDTWTSFPKGHGPRACPRVFANAAVLPSMIELGPLENDTKHYSSNKISSVDNGCLTESNKYWWDDFNNSNAVHRNLNMNRSKRYQTLEEENSGDLLIDFEEDDDGLMRSSKKSTKRSQSSVNFTHLTFPCSSSDEQSPPATSQQSPTDGVNTTSSSSGCSSNISGGLSKNNGVGRVRKSASVRFAVEQTPNCPKMTTSTSDYASMDNFQAFTGFENPNYSGPPPTISNAASNTPLVPKSDQIEMESMGKTKKREEWRVVVPNYVLLVGGLESHESHVIKKPNLTIWRLRLDFDQMYQQNNFNPFVHDPSYVAQRSCCILLDKQSLEGVRRESSNINIMLQPPSYASSMTASTRDLDWQSTHTTSTGF